jgi:hypothetical protein
MRRFLGVLVAVLTTTVVFGVVLVVLAWFGQGPSLVPSRLAAAGLQGLFALFALPPAAAVAVVLGLPLALRLERHGERGPRPYLLLGAALGIAPFVLFDIYVVGYEFFAAARRGLGDGLLTMIARQSRAVPRALAWLLIGGLCGAASAVAYWAVAVRGRVPRAAAALAVAVVALLAGGGCSKVTDTRVTDWCIRRSTVGPSFGHYSGSRSSECRVRSWGFWRKLDEVAVGPVIALDRDTVLIAVPGRRKLIRRGERQARFVCGDNEYGVLPPGHDAIDCVGFVDGPAIGVPTAVRFQRLDIRGRPVGEAAVIRADYDLEREDGGGVAHGRSGAITSAITGGSVGDGAGAGALTGGAAVTAAGPSVTGPEAPRPVSLRVFAGLAISYYDDARTPFFVTYDNQDLIHPDCVLLELQRGAVRAHRAAPGTSLRDCSERDAWSRVVGRALHAPE